MLEETTRHLSTRQEVSYPLSEPRFNPRAIKSLLNLASHQIPIKIDAIVPCIMSGIRTIQNSAPPDTNIKRLVTNLFAKLFDFRVNYLLLTLLKNGICKLIWGYNLRPQTLKIYILPVACYIHLKQILFFFLMNNSNPLTNVWI